MRLSIIIPFVNEYPQIIFTLQSVFNEIKNIDAEVIAIDNFCPEILEQEYETPANICPFCYEKLDAYRTRDCGGIQVKEYSEKIPNLIFDTYTKKLSHWNSKNHGVRRWAKGSVLLFLDAHVVPSPGSIKLMLDMFEAQNPNGTYHLPLTYILDLKKQLKYRLDVDPSRSYYGYTFAGYEPKMAAPEEVASMSTCGMMMTRELFDQMGGWPEELGIYGGGENYMNFVLATMGKSKWVCPVGPLSHFAAPRGYYYNYDDFVRNRAIAVYMITGSLHEAWNYLEHCQGNPETLREIHNSIFKAGLSEYGIMKHQEQLKDHQIIDIRTWLEIMKTKGLYDGSISKREYVS